MAQQKQRVMTSVGEIAYAERGRRAGGALRARRLPQQLLSGATSGRLSESARCLAPDLRPWRFARRGRTRTSRCAPKRTPSKPSARRSGLDQVDVVANDSGSAIAQIFAARSSGADRTLTLTNGDADANYPPRRLPPDRRDGQSGRLLRPARGVRGRPGPAAARLRRRIRTASTRSGRDAAGLMCSPLFATPEATRALERWLVSFDDTSQTREIEPLLRKLTAPTLIVWGAGDHFFPLKWAYWLKGVDSRRASGGRARGGEAVLPEERPDELADAMRAHWRASAALAAMA